MQFLFAS